MVGITEPMIQMTSLDLGVAAETKGFMQDVTDF
jgi:hypothetical protein